MRYSITEVQEGLAAKKFSATELVQGYVQTMQEKEKALHAFITQTPELALAQAGVIDEQIAQGKQLPVLAGVPCSIKDAILVQGVPCTAGSQMLKTYVAPYDATVVSNIKNAGAVIMGKTNMDEFGMGASTENSAFGVTHNPHNTSKVPGGSSGGSAASVAADQCIGSLGEDTGGSIRLPASFCGVVGLKPTYGRVSRYGSIALASSLDQVGVFAHTVKDTKTLFSVISGKDEKDATSIEYSSTPFRASKKQSLTIGIPKEYFAQGLDEQVEQAIRQGLQALEQAGAVLKEISLPHTQDALACYYIINMSEASANLARYDGIRYGLHQNGENLLESYKKTRGAVLGTEVKRRIMLGTYALSAGYYDAYYVQAQKVRTLLKQDFEKAFKEVDVIAGPVSPTLPFSIGEKATDPMAMYLVDIYTVPVNLVGLPGISVPTSMVQGLPVGMQFIAPPLQEETLFTAGSLLEKVRTYA